MDEQTWLSSVDPPAMLRFITENPDHENINCVRSPRKLRLFQDAVIGLTPVEYLERLGRLAAVRGMDLFYPIMLKEKPGDCCSFLRDIVGNPFRPVVLTTVRVGGNMGIPPAQPPWLSWNDRTVPRLAQRIYQDRVWDLMSILADALQDSGCCDPDILAHCRSGGIHVRGCWVLDLLLGKE